MSDQTDAVFTETEYMFHRENNDFTAANTTEYCSHDRSRQ